jgi:hypothetical protein
LKYHGFIQCISDVAILQRYTDPVELKRIVGRNRRRPVELIINQFNPDFGGEAADIKESLGLFDQIFLFPEWPFCLI